jgi:hypothetical protein
MLSLEAAMLSSSCFPRSALGECGLLFLLALFTSSACAGEAIQIEVQSIEWTPRADIDEQTISAAAQDPVVARENGKLEVRRKVKIIAAIDEDSIAFATETYRHKTWLGTTEHEVGMIVKVRPTEVKDGKIAFAIEAHLEEVAPGRDGNLLGKDLLGRKVYGPAIEEHTVRTSVGAPDGIPLSLGCLASSHSSPGKKVVHSARIIEVRATIVEVP